MTADVEVMNAGSAVRLTRVASPWRDRRRAYKVFLDGSQAGEIRDGESLTLPLDPGRHLVRLKIDWSGSHTLVLQLQPGECVYLECEPNGAAATAFSDLLRSTGRAKKPWVSLRRTTPVKAE
jgi:hypothetical protein